MSAQAFKNELVAYYQNLANQGIDLEAHRNQKLLQTYNQLNSAGLRFRRGLRGAICGVLPAGGFIHTEITSRAYAKRCMKAYCLDALDFPATNFGELILEAGLDILTSSITEMMAEGAVEVSMDFFIENAVETIFDSLISQSLGHFPIFGSIMAVVHVQKAMTEVLNKAHEQAEALHNSAIKTARANILANINSIPNEESAAWTDFFVCAIALLVACYFAMFFWGFLSH